MVLSNLKIAYTTHIELQESMPSLLSMCKTSPDVEHVVGGKFFTHYIAERAWDLQDFLYVIHEHPNLAKYVTKVTLSSTKDGPSNSGIYEMLAAVYHGEIDVTSPVLQSIAEDFFLVSFGDIEDVTDHVFFELLRSLFSAATNVIWVQMPKEWHGLFKVEDGFPHLTRLDLFEVV
jgi:hypothetical protein